MKKILSLVCAFAVAMALGGCSFTSVAEDTSGLNDMDGKKFKHVNTFNLGLGLLFQPCCGDATVAGTTKDMTMKAKENGAKKVRIVQSDATTWWFIFPPISFIIHPMTGEVAGDAILE